MGNLARMHAEYRADVLFNMLVAGLLGVVEQDPIARFAGKSSHHHSRSSGLGAIPGLQSVAMADNLLRLLTPTLKGNCSKTAISGLQECMECLGGVGYLENEDMQFNIARLYRDADIMPIWEGTTDMMADDSILRVLFGKIRHAALASFEQWTQALLDKLQDTGLFQEQLVTVRQWKLEVLTFVKNTSKEEAELKSRPTME